MIAHNDAAPRISEKDAARLLMTETIGGSFTIEDALKVVTYMRPKRIKAGSVFLRENEKENTDFIIIVLDGEVRTECKMGTDSQPQTLYVMGPGSLLGEVAMFKGYPRTASCVAINDVAVAVLSQTDLMKMVQNEPAVASQFLLAIASRMADRIAETTTKLKRFMQLNEVLHKEVYTLMDAQPEARAAVSPAKSTFAATEPMSLEDVQVLRNGLAGEKGEAIAKRLNQTKTDFADL
jgi:CRP/FNR family transcriptional regulator, cyclic AMP receptor protein